MNYANIIPCDIANGEGIRTSIFVSGCTNHCPGCFNEEAQNFSYGQKYTKKTKKIILEQIEKPYIAGLSILGGEPLHQDTIGLLQLIDLCEEVHKLNKNIWLWTGCVWEDIFNQNASTTDVARKELIKHCDVVVDGPFVEAKKDLTLAFKGSFNQRIIDIKKSLAENKIVIYKN